MGRKDVDVCAVRVHECACVRLDERHQRVAARRERRHKVLCVCGVCGVVSYACVLLLCVNAGEKGGMQTWRPSGVATTVWRVVRVWDPRSERVRKKEQSSSVIRSLPDSSNAIAFLFFFLSRFSSHLRNASDVQTVHANLQEVCPHVCPSTGEWNKKNNGGLNGLTWKKAK